MVNVLYLIQKVTNHSDVTMSFVHLIVYQRQCKHTTYIFRIASSHDALTVML